MTWALDVLRAALLEGNVELGRLMLLIGSAIVALPGSVALFRLAVDRVRHTGTLGQY